MTGVYGIETFACTACRGEEIIFTCSKCEKNYSVQHLEQPVTECPVCFWKPALKTAERD